MVETGIIEQMQEPVELMENTAENDFQNDIPSSDLKEKSFSHKQRGLFFGVGSLVLVLYFAIILFVSGKSTKAHADEGNIVTVQAPSAASENPSAEPAAAARPDVSKMQVKIDLNDGLPVTSSPNVPAVEAGISKRPEVMLTEHQASFVKNLSQFFEQIGKYAIVTSGTRSSESQLELIKDRIEENGVSEKFPKLEDASMADTSVWLKAWQWLRAKHVPINAPAEVKGVAVKTSMHLKGLAVDLISTNLSQLRSWVARYMSSPVAKQSKIKIAAIVLEPGCVHLNITA